VPATQAARLHKRRSPVQQHGRIAPGRRGRATQRRANLQAFYFARLLPLPDIADHLHVLGQGYHTHRTVTDRRVEMSTSHRLPVVTVAVRHKVWSAVPDITIVTYGHVEHAGFHHHDPSISMMRSH
jgi:hypothetical protein